METAHVPEPELELRDGTPVSRRFGDVYFSRGDGIAETEHVFLRGNDLPERWCGKPSFTIGELGFGSGLNFFVAWKRFCEAADAGATLHYISIEKFPFTLKQLHAVLALQPELKEQAEALLAAYPLRLPGIHRIHLNRVVLTLCFGDAAELLPQLNAPIDAWFLDGFAPAKNADMWSENVFTHLARLSAPGATFATFTAAGAVRRGLEAVGFAVEKVTGFGHKRDMLAGRRKKDDALAIMAPIKKRAVVVGAGIAGATLAHSLAERGIQVTVLERECVASGASGNPAAVLFPQLTKRWTVSASWYFTAYGFMLRQLKRWGAMHATPGMLRLPRHAEEEAQLRALNETLGLDAHIVHWLERDAASEKAGVTLASGGTWFPHGTWLEPVKLCYQLLQHDNILLREQVSVVSLTERGHAWVVTCGDGEEIVADICCVTAAEESKRLLVDYGLKLNEVGGQVSDIAAANVAAPLRSILCHKGYVIPRGETYLIGATYNHGNDAAAVTDANHEKNIAEVETFLPGWVKGAAMAGRSSFRATTPDRMPYVGAIDAGLYVSTGHGSRGMLSAPLASEMIASEVCGEQSPVTQALQSAVSPLRFRS